VLLSEVAGGVVLLFPPVFPLLPPPQAARESTSTKAIAITISLFILIFLHQFCFACVRQAARYHPATSYGGLVL
jgi:hypothetical protein